MSSQNKINVISILVAIFSSIASGIGMLSKFGKGNFQYESIRGITVDIYGKGIYQHMSSDVAIQGIAQDYVTLFIAVPLLVLSLISFNKGSAKSIFILAGTLSYFLVTYLFYIAMGMYNALFLVYAILLSLSFFGVFLSFENLFRIKLLISYSDRKLHKFVGWFLMINSVLIALLWLNVILPPLFDGRLYPPELQHYTTLIVQGFDLGLLLPICFLSGYLLSRRTPQGLIYGTVYVVFLAVLMSALSAKIVAMGINGVNIIPVVFIIPTINIITIFCSIYLVRSLKVSNKNTTAQQRL